jgi:hypothetical protein
MAKLSLKNREAKREATVRKYAARRAELKAIIDDQTRSMDERMDAMKRLQALPRNSVPQVRPGADQDPRGRHAWRHPGPDQGQLVSEEIER